MAALQPYPARPAPEATHRAWQRGSALPAGDDNARASEHRSEAEAKQLRELRARDREVRAHERAHAAAAGSLARGGPDYTWQRGQDGRNYAVGGEVSIDTSAVPGDPQATLRKARQIQRAALAPAEPSAQDRAVAAAAAAMAAAAQAEIARERTSGAERGATEDRGNETMVPAAGGGEGNAAACRVCGARHGEGAQAALNRHVEEHVMPRAPAGDRFAAVA